VLLTTLPHRCLNLSILIYMMTIISAITGHSIWKTQHCQNRCKFTADKQGILYLCLIKQRDNSVYRTCYGMVDCTVRVQLQERQTYFSPQRQNRLWHTLELLFRQQRGPNSGVQQPEHEADHRPPSPMLRMCAANPLSHTLSWCNGYQMC
jgi:hypothetical protein